MRQALPTIGAVIAAAFLQAALGPYMAIGGVVPNLMLLVVVTLALVEGPVAGCTVGFACGLIFDLLGSGPVRGFAVVHCLGILTSMFSAVVVSRGLVNLLYGSRRKLDKLPIGNTDWHKRNAVGAA